MDNANSCGALLEVSVLVTKEEYCYAAAYVRRAASGAKLTPAMISGAAACIAGFAGLLFGDKISFTVPAALCLIIGGLFLLLYDSVLAPMAARAAAAAEYDARADLRYSAVYSFTQERVAVRGGRVTGSVPLSLMTARHETPALFLLVFGPELLFAIPKRLLENGGERHLRELLSSEFK